MAHTHSASSSSHNNRKRERGGDVVVVGSAGSSRSIEFTLNEKRSFIHRLTTAFLDIDAAAAANAPPPLLPNQFIDSVLRRPAGAAAATSNSTTDDVVDHGHRQLLRSNLLELHAKSPNPNDALFFDFLQAYLVDVTVFTRIVDQEKALQETASANAAWIQDAQQVAFDPAQCAFLLLNDDNKDDGGGRRSGGGESFPTTSSSRVVTPMHRCLTTCGASCSFKGWPEGYCTSFRLHQICPHAYGSNEGSCYFRHFLNIDGRWWFFKHPKATGPSPSMTPDEARAQHKSNQTMKKGGVGGGGEAGGSVPPNPEWFKRAEQLGFDYTCGMFTHLNGTKSGVHQCRNTCKPNCVFQGWPNNHCSNFRKYEICPQAYGSRDGRCSFAHYGYFEGRWWFFKDPRATGPNPKRSAEQVMVEYEAKQRLRQSATAEANNRHHQRQY